MLQPETDLKDRSEEQQELMLAKIFRRYSKCEDAFLNPLEHAKAIKGRLYILFARYAERPEALKKVSYRLWSVGQLTQKLKGDQLSADCGIKNESLIDQTFYKVREGLSHV